MEKIKILKTNGVSGLKVHEVGRDGVTKIVDKSLQFEDSIILTYHVFVNEELKFAYENGVYEVEYFTTK